MDLKTAKQAVAAAIKAGGGYVAAADWMGCSPATLHNIQNLCKPDDPRDRPLGWLMKLDEFAGRPILLEALCASSGFALMEMSHVGEFSGLQSSFMDLVAAFGRLQTHGVESLEDSQIDSREERILRADILAAQSVIHAFTENLQTTREKFGGKVA